MFGELRFLLTAQHVEPIERWQPTSVASKDEQISAPASSAAATVVTKQPPIPFRQWYDAWDQLTPLLQVIQNSLSADQRQQILIMNPHTVDMLAETLNPIGEQCPFIPNVNNFYPNLQLLCIPMMVNSGAGQLINNHFTTVFVFRDAGYYIHDSMGMGSNYGRNWYEMLYYLEFFFGREHCTASRPVKKVLDSPKIIGEYSQEIDFKHYPHAISFLSNHQQQNSEDCGPATVDNILAAVQMQLAAIPAVFLPALLATRYLARGQKSFLQDYPMNDYYLQLRRIQSRWSVEHKLRLTTSQPIFPAALIDWLSTPRNYFQKEVILECHRQFAEYMHYEIPPELPLFITEHNAGVVISMEFFAAIINCYWYQSDHSMIQPLLTGLTMSLANKSNRHFRI